MATVSVDDVKIHFEDSGGDGMPVLFVHAFPLGAQMWEPQVEALQDRFRTITVDLQGFGDSGAPDDRTSYSMDTFAAQAKAVVDQLALNQVVLVGLSMGGYAALAFMRNYPGSATALVLADTRAEADSDEARAKRTKQQERIEAGDRDGVIETLVKGLLAEGTLSGKPDVVARVKRLMDNPPAGFIGALEAMKTRPDSTADLARIGIPTLVITGENDSITPRESAVKLQDYIGGARLVIVPDAGHLSNLEAPEAFNGALLEFLTELETA